LNDVADRADCPKHIQPDGGDAAFDLSDWAWEFLRRHPDYRRDWRGAVPRSLPVVRLDDGTELLRLRRRYPAAERWGLYAFADPSNAARCAPVFWLPNVSRRIIRVRGVPNGESVATARLKLADFRVRRTAVIGIDGAQIVTLKGYGTYVSLDIRDVPALARPLPLVVELDRLDDLGRHTDALKTLQHFMQLRPNDPPPRPAFGSDDRRFRHTLIALDESMAGKTYRQIAIAIHGEQRVAEEWGNGSDFLKDRMRRLVAKGRELMQSGYRDLLR
jgi:hypothetical protein